MSQTEAEVIVATTNRIEAYGGFQLDRSDLDELAEKLRGGTVPMNVGHDLRRPIRPLVLDAQVRERDDGEAEVWMRLLVDENEWTEFQDECRRVGAPGGMSFTRLDTIERLGQDSADSPTFVIAGTLRTPLMRRS